MAVSGIRRRLRILEHTGLFSSPRVCRPLAAADLEVFIKKLRQGIRLDLAEWSRWSSRHP